jgi:hypothetical protein
VLWPDRDALELSAAARRSWPGGAIERIVLIGRIVLIERALQPTGHLAQNVDVGVAHIGR